MKSRDSRPASRLILTLEGRVPAGADPQRLDDFLTSLLTEEEKRGQNLRITKSKIRRLLMAGAVTVDTRTVRQPAWEVRPGQRVRARVDLKLFTAEKDPGDLVYEVSPRDVLFEDEWLLVLNKPAGIPTEGTVVASRDSLHAAALRFLKARGGGTGEEVYLGLHHRLDRETSGVLLFTKCREANRGVHEMFLHHQARKVYRALTSAPAEKTKSVRSGTCFRVENHLGRISPSSSRGKWGEVPGGDWAATDLEVLSQGKGILLWEARPQTGRTHQIRVHLAGLGFPLLGDELYGGKPAARVMLHAFSLTFPHPRTGLEIRINAPLPEDFSALVRGFRPVEAPGSS